MLYRVTFLLAFTFFSSISLANPDHNVRYLMNEPMSMWDWGIYKIDKEVSELQPSDSSIVTPCYTLYDFTENNLIIRCAPARQGLASLSKEEGNEMVNWIVNRIRLNLGYYYPDNFNGYKHYRENSSFLKGSYPIMEFFSHTGYEKSDIPVALGKELEDIITIEIYTTDFKDGSDLQCKATLIDDFPLCANRSAEEVSKSFRNFLKVKK